MSNSNDINVIKKIVTSATEENYKSSHVVDSNVEVLFEEGGATADGIAKEEDGFILF